MATAQQPARKRRLDAALKRNLARRKAPHPVALRGPEAEAPPERGQTAAGEPATKGSR